MLQNFHIFNTLKYSKGFDVRYDNKVSFLNDFREILQKKTNV